MILILALEIKQALPPVPHQQDSPSPRVARGWRLEPFDAEQSGTLVVDAF